MSERRRRRNEKKRKKQHQFKSDYFCILLSSSVLSQKMNTYIFLCLVVVRFCFLLFAFTCVRCGQGLIMLMILYVYSWKYKLIYVCTLLGRKKGHKNPKGIQTDTENEHREKNMHKEGWMMMVKVKPHQNRNALLFSVLSCNTDKK